MIIAEKDILTVESGLICHQVNAKGKMGAGIALKIRKKWPEVYKAYRMMYESGLLKLGEMWPVPIKAGRLWVVNVCGQDRYGRDKQYTDYAAVRKALLSLKRWRDHYSNTFEEQISIYFPYKMGCVNAGGDWKVYSQIIEDIFPDAIICKYGD